MSIEGVARGDGVGDGVGDVVEVRVVMVDFLTAPFFLALTVGELSLPGGLVLLVGTAEVASEVVVVLVSLGGFSFSVLVGLSLGLIVVVSFSSLPDLPSSFSPLLSPPSFSSLGSAGVSGASTLSFGRSFGSSSRSSLRTEEPDFVEPLVGDWGTAVPAHSSIDSPSSSRCSKSCLGASLLGFPPILSMTKRFYFSLRSIFSAGARGDGRGLAVAVKECGVSKDSVQRAERENKLTTSCRRTYCMPLVLQD